MTREQIAALSDADLVRLVAEKVMGWQWRMHSAGHRAIMMTGGREDMPSAPCLEAVIGPYGNTWRPLIDWNHAWQVVEAMRAKGRVFMMHDQSDDDGPMAYVGIAFGPTREWPSMFVRHGNERRAILEVALLVMEATQ